MTDGHAATGFTRGFFGCFGVLAALAAVTGLALAYVAIWSRTHPLRRPDPMAFSADDLPAICARAASLTAAAYRTAGAPRASATPPALLSAALPGEAFCHVRDRRGVLLLAVRMDCRAISAPGCVVVTAASRGGELLDRR
jgi:hypothetical protein